MLDIPRDFTLALGSSYPEFPDSCLPQQFAFTEDVLNMFVDGLHRFLKQVGHLALGQPDILKRHARRLAEIHLSDLNSSCGHEPLSMAAVEAFQRVADLIPDSIPIILETPVTEDLISRELRKAEAIFHAPVPA